MVLKIKKNNGFFYLAYCFYIMALMTENIAIDDTHLVKQVCVIISMCILGIHYIYKINKKHIAIPKMSLFGVALVILCLFVLYLAISTSDYYLIAVILFSVGLKELDLEELFQISLIVLAFLTVCIVIFSLVGIIPMVESTRDTAYNHGGTRLGMGFKGGLFLPNIVSYCGCYFYSIKKGVRSLDFFAFQVLGTISFLLCNSRNGLVSLELLFILMLFWQTKKRSNKIQKVVKILAVSVLPVTSILSFYLLNAYKIGTPFSVWANKVLSGRLWGAMMNSFSSPFEWIHYETSVSFMENLKCAYDNGYFFLMARYGYLMLIIFSVMSIFIGKYMISKDNYAAAISFTIVCLMNFIDNGLISYGFFPYVLIGIYSMYRGTAEITNRYKLRSRKKSN